MFESPLFWLVIPLGALLAVIFGGMLIMRLQKKLREPLFPSGTEPTGGGAGRPEPTGWDASPSTFHQGAGESREDFVRRHRHRPGVVADGVTLVDLYDRIKRLEHRIAVLEGDRDEDVRGPRP
ncbi:hypothetical protein [Promicromonospora sp. NPDC023805]|uniref:hypothetical protein n=1 Tax=Promicromonospora sp. NPDC023805 TaxID=3154696 RepID=UPI0033FCEABB